MEKRVTFKNASNQTNKRVRLTHEAGGDLRVQLKPDTPLANMSMTFIDSDMDYPRRPSENVLVFEDGSINVCLRSSGPSGPILGPILA